MQRVVSALREKRQNLLAMIEQTKELEQQGSTSSNEFKVENFDYDKEQMILDDTFREVNFSDKSLYQCITRHYQRIYLKFIK